MQNRFAPDTDFIANLILNTGVNANWLLNGQGDMFNTASDAVEPGIKEEENQTKLESIDKLDAKCVVRIVLTPGQMRDFVEASVSNLDGYCQKSADGISDDTEQR